MTQGAIDRRRKHCLSSFPTEVAITTVTSCSPEETVPSAWLCGPDTEDITCWVSGLLQRHMATGTHRQIDGQGEGSWESVTFSPPGHPSLGRGRALTSYCRFYFTREEAEAMTEQAGRGPPAGPPWILLVTGSLDCGRNEHPWPLVPGACWPFM